MVEAPEVGDGGKEGAGDAEAGVVVDETGDYEGCDEQEEERWGGE